MSKYRSEEAKKRNKKRKRIVGIIGGIFIFAILVVPLASGFKSLYEELVGVDVYMEVDGSDGSKEKVYSTFPKEQADLYINYGLAKPVDPDYEPAPIEEPEVTTEDNSDSTEDTEKSEDEAGTSE